MKNLVETPEGGDLNWKTMEQLIKQNGFVDQQEIRKKLEPKQIIEMEDLGIYFTASC